MKYSKFQLIDILNFYLMKYSKFVLKVLLEY